MDGQFCGRWEKVGLNFISETIRCRKLKLGGDIGWGCRCATSWYDLDFTFNRAVVTLTFKNVWAVSQKPYGIES